MEISCVVDRVEGKFVVLNIADIFIDWPKALLEGRVREGDIIRFQMQIIEQGIDKSIKEPIVPKKIDL